MSKSMASSSSASQSPASSNITMNSEVSTMQEQQNIQQQQQQQQLWQLHQSKHQLLNANSQNFNVHGSLIHRPAPYNNNEHLQQSASNTSSCTSSSFHGSPAAAPLIDPCNPWESAMVSASNCISSGSNYINDSDSHLNAYNQQLAMQAAMAMASSVPSLGSSPPSSSCLSEVEQKPVVLNPNSATTSTCNSSGNAIINPNSLSNAMAIANSVNNAMASYPVMSNAMVNSINNAMASSITNAMLNPVSNGMPNAANSVLGNSVTAANLNPNQQLWLPAAAAAIPPSFGHGASVAAFNLANLISADPAFAERAAKFSSYTQGLVNPVLNQAPVNTKHDLIHPHSVPAAANNPTLTNNNTNNNNNNSKTLINNSAKSVNVNNNSLPAKGAIKAPPAAPPENKSPPPESKKRKTPPPTPKASENLEEGKKAKTSNKGDQNSGENKAQSSTSGNSGAESEHKSGKEVSKPDPPPAPKLDYIHVRARRGQATDSHSLAERVRREKISERMKYLQDLVPGCSKVTGKAMMLDEIINYVQSLQRQVEFLSMKLAAVHPTKMDFSFESLITKDVMQSAVINNHTGFGAPETAINPLYPFNLNDNMLLQGVNPGFQLAANPQAQQLTGSCITSSDHNPLGECISQIGGPWEDELQNMVQMGFPQNPLMGFNSLHGSMLHGQMKAEI